MQQHRYIFTGLFSIFILSTQLHAGSMGSTAGSLSGLYVGGGVNHSWVDVDLAHNQVTALNTPFSLIAFENFNQTYSANMHGFGGQIFVGYDYYMRPQFSLSLEAQANAGDIEKKFNSGATVVAQNGVQLLSVNHTGKIEQKWAAGLSLLPTFHAFNGIDLFGLIGWQISEFNISGSPGAISPLNQDVLAAYGSLPLTTVHSHQNLNGLMLGVGIKKHLSHSLSLRLDYNWTQFESMKVNGSSATVYAIDPAFPPISYVHNGTTGLDHPSTQQVKLSVVYQFA
ncbi:MAG: hypothetical protein CMF38_07405 [Legionellaceae bacterium]|nr:hypothetical protein [Legionellaceae bacterium]HAF88012.1 hypothetical protein [Legionellales bacterium]|tara:strand:- start:4701 stop:5549 length:849 start_codon:yes stop_codon:yes gene_type:complete